MIGLDRGRELTSALTLEPSSIEEDSVSSPPVRGVNAFASWRSRLASLLHCRYSPNDNFALHYLALMAGGAALILHYLALMAGGAALIPPTTPLSPRTEA